MPQQEQPADLVVRCGLYKCDVRMSQCVGCNFAMQIRGACRDVARVIELRDRDAVRFVGFHLDTIGNQFKFANPDVMARATHLRKKGEYLAPPKKENEMSTEEGSNPALEKLRSLAARPAAEAEPTPEAAKPEEPATEPEPKATSDEAAETTNAVPPSPEPAVEAPATEPAPAADAETSAPKRRGRKAKTEKDQTMPRGVPRIPRKAKADAAPATSKPGRKPGRAPKLVSKDGMVTLVQVAPGKFEAQTPKALRAANAAAKKLARAHKKALKALNKIKDVDQRLAEQLKLREAQKAELAAQPALKTIQVPASSL